MQVNQHLPLPLGLSYSPPPISTKNINQIYAGDLFMRILDMSKLELINNTVISNYLKTYPKYRCTETKTIKNKEGIFDFREGDTIFCVIKKGGLSHSPAQKKLLDNVNIFLEYMTEFSNRPIYDACLKQIKVNQLRSIGETSKDAPIHRNFLGEVRVDNTQPQIDSIPPLPEQMEDLPLNKDTSQVYAELMLMKIREMSKLENLVSHRKIARHLKSFSRYRCRETKTIKNSDGTFEFRKGDTIFCAIKRSEFSADQTNLLSNVETFISFMIKKYKNNSNYQNCLKQIKVNNPRLSLELEVDDVEQLKDDRMTPPQDRNTIQLYAELMLIKIREMSRFDLNNDNKAISKIIRIYSKYRCLETTTIENEDGTFVFHKGDTIFCTINRSQFSHVTTQKNLLLNAKTFMSYLKKNSKKNKVYRACLEQIKVNNPHPALEKEKEVAGNIPNPEQMEDATLFSPQKQSFPKLTTHRYNPLTQNFRSTKESDRVPSPQEQMESNNSDSPQSFPNLIFQQQNPLNRRLPLAAEFDLRPSLPKQMEEDQLIPSHKKSFPELIFQKADPSKRKLPPPSFHG